MTALVMNCSPVRDGATTETVRIAARCLRARHTVETVCIDDYQIHFCKGGRNCHTTAKCAQRDDVERLMKQFGQADRIVLVLPACWADVPGQFKAFIDRCTPWCNTHEPHAVIDGEKKGVISSPVPDILLGVHHRLPAVESTGGNIGELISMVCEVMHNEALKTEPATPKDLSMAQGLLDPLTAHEDGCVGMTANTLDMNRRIIILSDTHGLLRPEVLNYLSQADAVIHGGDINTQAIVDTLQSFAPLHIVRGSNDKERAEGLPHSLTFIIEGIRFFPVHNKRDVSTDPSGVDVVVYGHSHKYACENRGGVLWLNPGSCGRRRFDQETAFAVMTAENGRFQVEKVTIPHEQK